MYAPGAWHSSIRRPKPMTAPRHHADILVTGHSLTAALVAVVSRKRGAQVVWAGAPPAEATQLGRVEARQAPSLFASLAHLPGLADVLKEVGVAAEIDRALVPVSIQVLDANRRSDYLPGDSMARSAAQWAAASKEAPSFKAWTHSGWRKRRARLLAEVRPPDAGHDREIGDLLAEIFASPAFAAGVGAQSKWLPGGERWLVNLLWKRFSELGGRSIPHGLSGAASSFRYGWSDVELKLGTGEQLGARAFIAGVDDPAFAHLTSSGTRRGRQLLEKLAVSSSRPLWRLTMAVNTRGLPAQLGPVALLPGAPALLLERHPGPAEVDALSVFWRAAAPPDENTLDAIRARIDAVLPFFKRHVVAADTPARVPYADDVGSDRAYRVARRVLVARTPAQTLTGPDGAALLALGLSDLALRLAPRSPAKT